MLVLIEPCRKSARAVGDGGSTTLTGATERTKLTRKTAHERSPISVLGRLLTSGFFVISSYGTAHAEWRYCFALQGKKIVLSVPFTSNAPASDIEALFQRMLVQAGVRHGTVGCPRADGEQQIIDARTYAISSNKQFFSREAIEVNWTPSGVP